MQKTLVNIGALTIVLASVALLAFFYTQPYKALGEINSASCVASTTRVIVGNQASSVVFATSSNNRAFAKISQPVAATNTVSLSFSRGAAATLLNGEILAKASTTPGERSIEFGTNTNFPYGGAVTALTDAGSTTVIVTECLY